jgi:hypothetical protein
LGEKEEEEEEPGLLLTVHKKETCIDSRRNSWQFNIIIDQIEAQMSGK